MRFDHPEWLLLLPLLVLAGWKWRRLGLNEPLRVFMLLLLVLLLAGLEVRRGGKGLDLWVLVDRSESAQRAISQNGTEWRHLLENTKSGSDRVFWVDYATSARLDEGRGEPYEDKLLQSRTGFAIDYALSKMNTDRSNRLLVLTDGYHTEPLGKSLELLRSSETALDYLMTRNPGEADLYLDTFELPVRVQPGEAFLVSARVRGAPDQEFDYRLFVGEEEILKGHGRVEKGEAWLRFTDRINQPGAFRYRLRIEGQKDQIPENNEVRRWIEAGGESRILLVTAYQDDPLETILKGKGFPVEKVLDPSVLNEGSMTGVRALILNNISADRLPQEFVKSVDFNVRFQGRGLLMVGGRNSFGSGGYQGSSLDSLLPVSMELKKEHRKLAVAMSVVLDRSGSMAVGVAGGRTKMDLANDGAARAIELLGPEDSISVFAVDSESHTIIEQSEIGEKREKLLKTVRRINSQGGGIYVYEGLKAGWASLKKAEVGQRHLILFADANDAEQPGDYIKLLKEIVGDGGVVSVIGLGKESDQDAGFLKDVAKRGGGRIFFSERAEDIPALFAQETVAIARSAFLKDPVGLQATPGWAQISTKAAAWPGQIDGYNLSYLRPEATAAAISGDEYQAPLVAFWPRGYGRAAAVSFPMGGDFSQRVRAWPGYADFTQTLARWLAGVDTPPGVSVRTELNGDLLEIHFLHDNNWQERVASSTPQIMISRSDEKEPQSLAWERMNPGHYQAQLRLDADVLVHGVVQVAGHVLPFGPVVNGQSAEWRQDPERPQELAYVSQESGGREVTDLSRIWKAPTRIALGRVEEILLILLLLSALLDALLTRLDFSPGSRLVSWWRKKESV